MAKHMALCAVLVGPRVSDGVRPDAVAPSVAEALPLLKMLAG